MNTQERENQTNTQQSSSLVKVLKDGYRFEFKDGDDTIECWGSGKSGDESVFVNGEKVSGFRNLFKRKSLHTFQHKGHDYEVEFNMVSIIRAELHCILIKDGVHFQTKKFVPTTIATNKPMSVKTLLIDFLIFGAIGAVIGYTMARYSNTTESTIDSVNALVSLFTSFVA